MSSFAETIDVSFAADADGHCEEWRHPLSYSHNELITLLIDHPQQIYKVVLEILQTAVVGCTFDPIDTHIGNEKSIFNSNDHLESR